MERLDMNQLLYEKLMVVRRVLANTAHEYVSCNNEQKRQALKSELDALVKAEQQARTNWRNAMES